jgi:hypothetical protein
VPISEIFGASGFRADGERFGFRAAAIQAEFAGVARSPLWAPVNSRRVGFV